MITLTLVTYYARSARGIWDVGGFVWSPHGITVNIFVALGFTFLFVLDQNGAGTAIVTISCYRP